MQRFMTGLMMAFCLGMMTWSPIWAGTTLPFDGAGEVPKTVTGLGQAAPTVQSRPPRPQVRVRVAGYNIAHARGNESGGLKELGRRKNLKGIVRLLKAEKIDVVGLTEISNGDLRAGFQHQPKYLAEELGFHYVYGENVQVLGGVLATQGNAVVSRFPILSSKNHPLYRINKQQEQRSCLEALLDLGKGRKARIFVAHLSLKPEESTRQIEEIWSMVEKSAEPVVLVGDFNSRPGSDRVKWLSERMKDTTSRLKSTYLNKPGVKIDYQFTFGAIRAEKAWIKGFDEGYSDHGCVINDYWFR